MHSNLNHDSANPQEYPFRTHLQAALEFAESIVETVREPLVVLNTDLQVQTANRAFYHTFQVSSEETKNRFFYELGNGQWNIPVLRNLLEKVLSHNIAFEDFEVEHEFQHIGPKIMLLNARQIVQEDLQTGMVLLAIEDVTERKQIEQSLKLLNAKLEQSNRELQDFASVTSHDLQEPLRKIQAFGDLLVQEYGELLPEPGNQYLQRMQNAAARMQALINDLLAFSRITTKAQPFSSVDLNQIVREVLSDLEIHIQTVGAKLEVSHLPTIDADPLQMRQLIQNLVSNALKFHQPSVPPVIQIQAETNQRRTRANHAESPELCRILIEDNGIGFDEKYLDRIFTVFQRLHYRNEYEGTGVGLAICRKITERHGGSITANSSPGKGSTFIVTLPVHQPITL
ncbi:MAG TPA: ATP-binding protein [Allocoleopsis sp.]